MATSELALITATHRHHWGRTGPALTFALTHMQSHRVHSPNNGAVGIKFLHLHSQCFGSSLDVICLMYLVYVLWHFFQDNLIIINHPHRPSFAKSECAERWLDASQERDTDGLYVTLPHQDSPPENWQDEKLFSLLPWLGREPMTSCTTRFHNK